MPQKLAGQLIEIPVMGALGGLRNSMPATNPYAAGGAGTPSLMAAPANTKWFPGPVAPPTLSGPGGPIEVY